MTDADGMDWPPDTNPIFSGWDAKDGYDPPLSSAWERGETNDYITGAVERMNVTTKRQMFAAEINRHKAKMEAAQRHLAALDNIPDEDPFTDGTVLLVRWKQYTYAALRMRSFWYTTGRQNGGTVSGLYRVPWARFADWLVEGYVKELVEMAPVHTWPLTPDAPRPGVNQDVTIVGLEGLRRVPCTVGNVHLPHVWYVAEQRNADYSQVVCPGVGSAALAESYPGAAALLDKIKADPNREPVTDPPGAYAQDGPPLPVGLTDDEKIRSLAEKVALWRSVAANPLHGIGGHTAAPSHTCALKEPHRAHLWPGPTGALTTCTGQEGAPGEQS